jgi:IclR family KDG regulon transcriptional repressor
MDDGGTISRVMRLISLLADHPEITAKQAATFLGWPVSTSHRMLRTLSEAEFATQKGPGLFAPGLELYRIAGRLRASMPYADIAEPLLVSLSEQFNETSLLTVLERAALRSYIACSAAPRDPMRYNIELNRRGLLVWGASGRSILAHLPDEDVERAILDCDGADIQGRELDAEELRSCLETIRRNGYGVVASQRVLHAVGVAVPILDARGEAVASIAFQVPEFRYNPKRLPALVAALRQTAAVIAQRIGSGSGP